VPPRRRRNRHPRPQRLTARRALPAAFNQPRLVLGRIPSPTTARDDFHTLQPSTRSHSASTSAGTNASISASHTATPDPYPSAIPSHETTRHRSTSTTAAVPNSTRQRKKGHSARLTLDRRIPRLARRQVGQQLSALRALPEGSKPPRPSSWPFAIGSVTSPPASPAGSRRGTATAPKFQNQVRLRGISPSFAFVAEPETNGVIERLFRTLKEQVIPGRVSRPSTWSTTPSATSSPATTQNGWSPGTLAQPARHPRGMARHTAQPRGMKPSEGPENRAQY
jgi:hypothetical protein